MSNSFKTANMAQPDEVIDEPLISVLVPAFNVASYIEQAVLSILNQSWKNLELIVVDDASTDETPLILSRMSLSDSRLRIIRNDQNRKIVASLNNAFSMARGEYIARMDGDDISAPDRLRKQMDFLKENPSIDMVGLNVLLIDEQSREIHKMMYPTDHAAIVHAARFVSPIPHFWLARRKLYDTLQEYRIPTAEDYDFILRAIDGGFGLANLKDILYYQRVRAGNTATASGLVQRRSVEYVRRLHKERQRSHTLRDSYSVSAVNSLAVIHPIRKLLYSYSVSFHSTYLRCLSNKKPYIVSAFYRLLSLIFSPFYQGKEIYRRYRYKSLMKALGG